MKFLRVGELHNEIPAILDKNKQIRDISSIIKDLNPETINQKTINKLNQSNVENLPIIKEPIRIVQIIHTNKSPITEYNKKIFM